MKFGKKLAVIGLIMTMTASMLAGCGSGPDGKKTVTTVNGETLSLGTLAFYVKYQQASMTMMFSSMMSQMGGALFDTVADEESGRTVGAGMVTDSLDMLERFVVVSQHAADYGVELSDDDKAEIDRIAQAYIDENDKSIRDKIGASKEDVARLLTLATINNRMLEPMAADVDREVSDEESVQTLLTLVSVRTSDDLDAETAKAEAQAVLDAALEDETALENAKDISEDAVVTTPNFTTADPSDSSVDQAVMDAVAGLKDGEIVDHVIEAEDGSSFFVVKVETLNDEESTATKKTDILVERMNTNRDDLITQWIDESEITRDEAVLATLTVTDAEPYIMSLDEQENAEDAG